MCSGLSTFYDCCDFRIWILGYPAIITAYGGATSSIRFPNVKFFVCFLNGLMIFYKINEIFERNRCFMIS